MVDPTTAEPPAAATVPSRAPPPIREDCWSEDATSTLVDAWGRRYLELNRGNLRQKDWQEVADAVNALHAHLKKPRRTDVQCKNRIDTLKKKYKLEKSRVSASASSWPFFSRLDALIGPNVDSLKKKPLPPSNPSPVPVSLPLAGFRKAPPTPAAAPQSVLPQKRRAPPPVDDSYFRNNYSALAAAAAAAADSEAEDEDEDEDSEEDSRSGGGRREGEPEGIRRLARAIVNFGEIYERVEGEKQRQMIELEKQRMQFAKDLEFQRMQMFMDMQVQLEKVKRSKRSGSSGDDVYS